MARETTARGRARGVAAGIATAALMLAGCTGGPVDDTGAAGLTIGTTDEVSTLDPAGSYDTGSFAVQNQVFPFLMNSPYGSPDVEPDIAVSAGFTGPTQYTVILKPDLVWANGNALTSSDVKFSFDRQVAIAAEDGPSSLLYNLESVDAPDDTTVVFTLTTPDDQVFPQILASPVGPIVDEESFSATEISSDDDIVQAEAFGGQYVITSYEANNLIGYTANPDYAGLLGPAKTDVVNVKYFADSANLALEVQEGSVDVAYRSLSATDIDELRGNDDVEVVDGPGGEIRFITFNFNTQPFGATTADADPAKALAVRQAVADLIDRDLIADQVYQGSYTPLYSYVPVGLTGATESLRAVYGDGDGAPNAEKAAATLAAAGVTEPVDLDLHYSTDSFGPTSDEEYALIAEQLEASGLFSVDLQATAGEQYPQESPSAQYPAYQYGWFPTYSDADNYLTPLFLTENYLDNHYADQEVNDLILQQAVTADAAARTALLGEIQDRIATQLPTVPLLQGTQVAVTGTTVSGASDTLDASNKFRYGALAKD